MCDDMNSKDLMVGTLIGGLVGASLALLFAPKSGRELRRDLNDGATQIVHRAGEWKDTAQVKGIEWKDRALHKGSELKQLAVDSTTQLTKSVSEKTNDLEKAVQDKLQSDAEKKDGTLTGADEATKSTTVQERVEVATENK
ncbi:MAG TPA: YtxH domain-containing protein [Bacillota bacterium]